MTGCTLAAPQSADEFLSLIDRCATAAGGPGWASLALTGAATAVVLFLLAALVGALLARVGS
jgi:hypothetical protein